MSDTSTSPDLIHSYLALRKSVGWIGTLLPFALYLGLLILAREGLQPSISDYYYTRVGNLLVGALCAVALFLFFYAGYSKLDDWTGHVAAVFALGVAWFPCNEGGAITVLHFTSAASLFVVLAFFSMFLFTKDDGNPTSEKKRRNLIYYSCGGIMLAAIAAMGLYKILEPEEGLGGLIHLLG